MQWDLYVFSTRHGAGRVQGIGGSFLYLSPGSIYFIDKLQQQANNTFSFTCTDLFITVFSRLAGLVLEQRWGYFKDFLSKALLSELIFPPFFQRKKKVSSVQFIY